MRENTASPRGYLYLKLFIFAIVTLTIGICVLRGVRTVQERSFVGSSYNTLYVTPDSSYLVSYHAPQKKSVVRVRDFSRQIIEKNNLLGLSLLSGVVVDGVVVDSDPVDPHNIFSLPASLSMFFFPMKYYLVDINGADALKYNFMLKAVNTDNSIVEMEKKDRGDDLSNFFRSEDIFNSAVSVEVMNAAGVSGLGSEFSEVLQRRGYNVIAVTNASKESDSSFIVVNRDTDSLTTQSLLHLGGGRVRGLDVSEAADVVLVLGHDAVPKK